MAVEEVLRLLTTNPLYRDRVVHTEIIEPKPPRYGTPVSYTHLTLPTNREV